MNKLSLFLPTVLGLRECQQVGGGERKKEEQESDINIKSPLLPGSSSKCGAYPYYPCSELIC